MGGGKQRPETHVTANPMFEVLIRANCFVRNEEPHIWDLLDLRLSLRVHRGRCLHAARVLRGLDGNINSQHS